ncbi:MAG TPA: glycosyltransferase family 4 protein [Stellaceae bacterium]|nr:glycosyltransferase family 4 protein [Stellaceae bacterium]
MPVLLVAAASFVVSCLGTRALIGLLRQRVLDLPNERSSHVVPTPRGGGIAVIAAIAVAWIAFAVAGIAPPPVAAVAVAGAGLAAISWLDDLRGLSQGIRLLAQFAAVVAGLWVLPTGLVFQGWLPPGLDAVAAALLWVWFVNLFNFMDGIDGIAASEAAAIAIGVVLLAAGNAGLTGPAAAVAAAALGFLVWNWMPARIFLGDVGSVPLGYVLGYLLYRLALAGKWEAALILPLYFLADATITLLHRLVRGARVWQAHREHFYQRAVQRGLSHAAVVIRVVAADIVLLGCAFAAVQGWGFGALAAAAATVAALLVVLRRGAG